jgi:hypothetical protein
MLRHAKKQKAQTIQKAPLPGEGPFAIRKKEEKYKPIADWL